MPRQNRVRGKTASRSGTCSSQFCLLWYSMDLHCLVKWFNVLLWSPIYKVLYITLCSSIINLEQACIKSIRIKKKLGYAMIRSLDFKYFLINTTVNTLFILYISDCSKNGFFLRDAILRHSRSRLSIRPFSKDSIELPEDQKYVIFFETVSENIFCQQNP